MSRGLRAGRKTLLLHLAIAGLAVLPLLTGLAGREAFTSSAPGRSFQDGMPLSGAVRGPLQRRQHRPAWLSGRRRPACSSPKFRCTDTTVESSATGQRRQMTLRQWIRYLTSVHGISGAVSVLGGSIWTTVRLAMGHRAASSSEVVVNVVLSAIILATGLTRLRKQKNQDVVLKFWVGISIQFFALFQILEAPLLGWIPYSLFGNWISRFWGVASVYFYVKWLRRIKEWNDAYETKSDKTVARIFHPLMGPAMGSVVVMEVVTFINFVELHFNTVSSCPAAQMLFMDSQLVSLAVNNVAQFTLTLANQKKVEQIKPLFYWLGAFGAVQFGLLMWVHLHHLGWSGLNAITLIPSLCRGV